MLEKRFFPSRNVQHQHFHSCYNTCHKTALTVLITYFNFFQQMKLVKNTLKKQLKDVNKLWCWFKHVLTKFAW